MRYILVIVVYLATLSVGQIKTSTNKLKWIWNEAVLARFKVLSRHLPGKTKANHKGRRPPGQDMKWDLENTNHKWHPLDIRFRYTWYKRDLSKIIWSSIFRRDVICFTLKTTSVYLKYFIVGVLTLCKYWLCKDLWLFLTVNRIFTNFLIRICTVICSLEYCVRRTRQEEQSRLIFTCAKKCNFLTNIHFKHVIFVTPYTRVRRGTINTQQLSLQPVGAEHQNSTVATVLWTHYDYRIPTVDGE
jgi:hypothetical protein